VQYRQRRYRRVEACPRDLRGIAIATRRGLALRAADHLWSGRKRLYQYDVGYRMTEGRPQGGSRSFSSLRADIRLAPNGRRKHPSSRHPATPVPERRADHAC